MIATHPKRRYSSGRTETFPFTRRTDWQLEARNHPRRLPSTTRWFYSCMNGGVLCRAGEKPTMRTSAIQTAMALGYHEGRRRNDIRSGFAFGEPSPANHQPYRCGESFGWSNKIQNLSQGPNSAVTCETHRLPDKSRVSSFR